MPDLLRHIPHLNASGRGRCVFCESSDGFSATPEKGWGGLWQCFSCGAGGHGVGYLQAVHGYSKEDAAGALGVEVRSDWTPTQKKNHQVWIQRERTAKEVQREVYANILEMERLRRAMTEGQKVWWLTLGELEMSEDEFTAEVARAATAHFERMVIRQMETGEYFEPEQAINDVLTILRES